MDFIEGLPMSDTYENILVIICRLSKQGIFIPCHKEDMSMRLTELYLEHVFSKHGAPGDIISDRGKLFVSNFWRSLCELLSVKCNLSTAYHPETDGQTERLNQSLEQYIRLYVNYQQDNWKSLLPLCEFAYNNTPHSATQVSPFFANKGYHPKLDIGIDNVTSYAAQQMATDLSELHAYLREQVGIAIAHYQTSTGSQRITPPDFKVGAYVWLNSKNIKTKRQSKKLDYRRFGPYRIIGKVSSHAFRLALPPSLKSIHPVFHVHLLEPHYPDDIPNRRSSPPPPIELEEQLEYEVSTILDSRRHYRRLQYLVEWSGYEDTVEQFSWEPLENLQNATDHLADFHCRHPTKPHN